MFDQLRRWFAQRPASGDLSRLRLIATTAHADMETLGTASDRDLRDRLAELPADAIHDDQHLTRLLVLLATISARTVELQPYPSQLQATAAMLRGLSVEMATGEGKTLVGAMVAAGFALSGRKVHVLAANDYLAARDAEWMGPLLRGAGLEFGAVTSSTSHEERRELHRRDVVYISVSEAGFDLLRDRLCLDPEDRVGLTRDAAVVDEADAVLLDEARVPLVLAGEYPHALEAADGEIARFVSSLELDTHYEVAPDGLTVNLTDDGIQNLEDRFPDAALFTVESDLLTRVNVALHAEVLLIRDVDYVMREDRLGVVSQSRGRVDALQRWPEGLQRALEAKEGLGGSGEVRVLDQIAVADLLAGYETVAGMSATLVSAAEDLDTMYRLRVAAVGSHRPCVRTDHPHQLYATAGQRDHAALEWVGEAHALGRPVLVATQSVAESERFAEFIASHHLDAVLLNARNDADEAQIIAQAGAAGRITVSTQMAGRGTDILLDEASRAAGGLLVIGIGRFPSRRLDDQLRGRAGRQGDPGDSVFLVSLEDELIRLHAPEHQSPREEGGDGRITDRRLVRLPDHAQHGSDLQATSLRWLSYRYAQLLSRQRQEMLAIRERLLTDDETLLGFEREGWAGLSIVRERLGERPLPTHDIRAIVLTCLDRVWSDHLQFASEVREGIHLRMLVREDPLIAFNRIVTDAYSSVLDGALGEASQMLADIPILDDGSLDLARIEEFKPSATWAYTVTDNSLGSELERLAKGLFKKQR